MAKGWTTLETVNKVTKDTRTPAEKAKADRHFDNLIRNTKSLTCAELKKASKDAYKAQKEYEDQLIQAYADKKLKSKDKIAEARKLIKARKDAEAKRKAEAEKAAAKKEDASQTA